LPHLSVSSTMNLPNSAGDIGIGTPPKSASRALIVASARPALIASLSLSTISAGEAAARKSPLLRRLWGLSGHRSASSIYEYTPLRISLRH
jgi:hypothetical protein